MDIWAAHAEKLDNENVQSLGNLNTVHQQGPDHPRKPHGPITGLQVIIGLILLSATVFWPGQHCMCEIFSMNAVGALIYTVFFSNNS